MRRGVLVGLVTLWALGACRSPGPPTVFCASTSGPSGPDDTLAIRLTLGAIPRDGEADVLVRVDPLSSRVVPSSAAAPPPTAGAVSLALTTDATFQGCANASPGGFRLHAADAPLGRLWIRVSSDRPVVVHAPRRVASGEDGAWTSAGPRASVVEPGALDDADVRDGPRTLTVVPGSSGRTRWPILSEAGAPE